MERWFVAIQGKKFGPYTLEELRKIVSHRLLQPDDHVWKYGMSAWLPADQIPDLFPLPNQELNNASDQVDAVTTNPETREWYYNHAGEKVGPLTLTELRRLVEQGKVTKATFLWRHGSRTGWLPATEHSAIFHHLKDRPAPRANPLVQILTKLKVLS